MIKLLSGNISESSLEIYGLDVEQGIESDNEGYNLGDLLNMPYIVGIWAKDHQKDTGYLERRVEVISKIYPNSFLATYLNSRPADEHIPNIVRLKMALRKYIINNIGRIQSVFRAIRDPGVLCVHLRSGDKGAVSKNYLEKIKLLSDNYKQVIVFSGIHLDQRFSSHQNSKSSLAQSLNEILGLNKNIYVYLDQPDVHLSLMSLASNLLVHRGGFSILATLVSRGNLYITNEFKIHENWNALNIPHTRI